ncbi:hypothetical protein BGZ61DRAFT_40670 [Ilyonectria robusta]|uniref:uncharacterized protein n=1 Tax=Ilyonectria robusta TaxID=1079257 RepID=UPI001E8E5906|nr:uncharacterized protein BGZ61DRAFT_40670 [Ilyonectria robusta]KAH8688276.1 hypothetical protein BGZ61DRAFT_40670 [Ilyonectria robusta]
MRRSRPGQSGAHLKVRRAEFLLVLLSWRCSLESPRGCLPRRAVSPGFPPGRAGPQGHTRRENGDCYDASQEEEKDDLRPAGQPILGLLVWDIPRRVGVKLDDDGPPIGIVDCVPSLDFLVRGEFKEAMKALPDVGHLEVFLGCGVAEDCGSAGSVVLRGVTCGAVLMLRTFSRVGLYASRLFYVDG